jgi:hypothetical protein
MTMQESLGDFLLRRLQEVGIQHIFSVPGDYHLELMQQAVFAVIDRLDLLHVQLFGQGKQLGEGRPYLRFKSRCQKLSQLVLIIRIFLPQLLIPHCPANTFGTDHAPQKISLFVESEYSGAKKWGVF